MGFSFYWRFGFEYGLICILTRIDQQGVETQDAFACLLLSIVGVGVARGHARLLFDQRSKCRLKKWKMVEFVPSLTNNTS